MGNVDKRLEAGQPVVYQIRVQGRLDAGWSDWFDGMTTTFEKSSGGVSITTLCGVVADQAVLRGILGKLWDLNLTLISVVPVETDGL